MLTLSFYIFSPALAFLISCYTIYHFYTRPSLIVFFFDLGSAYRSAVILTLRTTKEEKKHTSKNRHYVDYMRGYPSKSVRRSLAPFQKWRLEERFLQVGQSGFIY